ncbi:hypothetical protein [Spirosoma endophyticum]|nr:hypothetical protein [Spirosoma endophyticum]
MALWSINVAKVEQGLTAQADERKAFTMVDVKTRYHNELLLKRFISILPEAANISLNNSQIRQLYSFG